MSKKHFIALADDIRRANAMGSGFSKEQIEIIADFCKAQNSNFNRERWLSYIAGECGPNGGDVKRQWDLYWSPEGRKIATVEATSAVKAVRKAPQPYRKALGEVYAVVAA